MCKRSFVMQVQLVIKMCQLITDCVMRHAKFARNLLVAHAGSKTAGHNKLAWSQDFQCMNRTNAAQVETVLTYQADFNLGTAPGFTRLQCFQRNLRNGFRRQLGPFAFQ